MSSRASTSSDGRFGYVVAVIVNAILLGVVNRWPGWQAVPFLTQDAASVVTLVNLSLVLGVVTNLVYLVVHPGWLKALGEVLTTGVSLAVVIRTLQVFPFDFGDSTVDWAFWTRVLLWFLLVVIGIALIVQLGRFFRSIAGGSDSER